MVLREPFGKKLDKRQLNINDTQETYTSLHTQICYTKTSLTELNKESDYVMATADGQHRTLVHKP